MNPSYLLAALLCAATAAGAQVLPGQIVRDPDHPQWLQRAGGEHLFLCGPGDPEDFFFRGTRLPDGTRDGDQGALIAQVAQQGGNTLYVEAVRSHGGDGDATHNPFVDSDPALGLDEDILDQWEGWLDQAHAAGLVVFFFVYDDSAKIWPTDAGVHPDEEAFLTALVDRFEHHPHLIFFLSEESEEARTDAMARQLAQVMADADDHDHLIGNHHHTGTKFKSWAQGSAFEVFAVHDNVLGDQIHHDSVTIFETATTKGSYLGEPGNAYMAIMSEALFTLNGTSAERRWYIWDAAMGGLQSVVFGMDIASTPPAEHLACQTLIDFMESGPFWTLVPADARAAGVTRWALGSDGVAAVAYTREPVGELGLTDMSAGTVTLHWVDTITGATVEQRNVAVSAGTNLFARPSGIGAEAAVWVRPAWTDLGQALAGDRGAPQLAAEGSLGPESPLELHVWAAPGPVTGVAVVGLANVSAPFKQGVLVPAPDFLLNLPVGPSGALTLATTWPEGAPSGVPLSVQVWFPDPSGPAGFTATNGVTATTP